MPALLEVRDLQTHFTTRDGVVKAVDRVTFTLEPGKTLAVVGESGSGKSVTALSIMRLVAGPKGSVVGGSVLFKGEDILKMDDAGVRSLRGDRIAMIFQDPMTSLNPVFRVGRQIGESLILHKGMSRAEAFERAVELLDVVGIPNPRDRAKEYPHQYSGGMRQRAMIAMALACEPDILIADEPTTALDVTIQAQILELMVAMQQRTGAAIIMITHDLGVVADLADDVMVMYAGRQAEYGQADSVFYDPLHPYTWGLLDSLPRHDVDKKSVLHPITGHPPSLINVPPGCAFHPRCPYAQEICASTEPPVVDVSGGHVSACHFSSDPEFRRGVAVACGEPEVTSA
ncbi:MAG: ABC transporter ATP-binding protein [Clostridiales bacterium]|nr:ABC transporter ATP-binding protein [Clostridiales bacterium]